ncbi:MAG: bifunctional riboflavin kinase/FAD synthetase [Syntrophomonadaceae bacterium]
MEIIREIDNYVQNNQPLYLALGNFDGVHRGHRYLISEVVKKARLHHGIAAAFIFEPHPLKILNPAKAPKLLNITRRKTLLLEELGLDLLVYNSFSPEIARWSPEQFVEKILVDKFNAKEVFIGFNYSFGHKGAGNPQLLENLGNQWGFKVNIILPVKIGEQTVSSTLIRSALENGDINQAYTMLGYYPILEGEVVEGEKRGRVIGFPTANITISPEVQTPGKGVYAALAVVDSEIHKCVVNIGNKPTFHDTHPVTVEAHLIDFCQNIYGEWIELHFLQKIRDEKKFAGMDELKIQIAQDRQRADLICAQFSLPLEKSRQC